MKPPRHPSLYQINTRVTLLELSQILGRRVTLDDIPDAYLDRIAERGFDWAWFLGVWQTGPAARQVSLNYPQWLDEFRAVLPDFTEADVAGSPFAVQAYAVHKDFGGGQSLARLRERLARRGLRLLLDFVPNHTAPDHPWVDSHPEYYIHGTDDDLAREPQNYMRAGSSVLAYGRDPNFPGWPDTLQLNYRHAGLRRAMIHTLKRIAGMCDGVRCDMAMLVLPEVIARTWGEKSGPADGSPPVDESFWPEAVSEVRQVQPDFAFMAEVYWDLEWTLQQQGFDYTYDKRMYDRLRAQDAGPVRGHLRADAGFMRQSIRFLETHDEPRAASVFPPDVHQAAAVLAYLVPGLRLFHDGQLEGRRCRVPIHLGRRREEEPDPALQAFYSHLLECLRRDEVREGDWQLLEPRHAWDGNPTYEKFIAFTWVGGNGSAGMLVAVNYGPTQGQCYIRPQFPAMRGRVFILRDLMNPHYMYERDGTAIADRGLYLDMPAWGYYVFEALLK